MVRSLSRGRFDRSSPGLLETDSYDRGSDTLRVSSMKKQSYTPRGTSRVTELYATPPRSPLDRPSPLDGRSTSRGSRLSREYDYDDHRNPISEGRSYSHSTYGRSSSNMRERFDDDGVDNLSHASLGGGSAAHARDVLSKMHQRGPRGMYSEPSKPPLRSLGRNMTGLSLASPRRRLDLHDDDMYENHHLHEDLSNVGPASRYEVMGMKEELKKKSNETTALRRELDEMQMKHEEGVTNVRSKLVSTFKEDMQEMKTEWEEAFQRLKDESDTTARAMEMELNEATRLKSDMEGELNQVKAEYRTQMEDLKKSKEDDLERLRAMYEEHLDGTKKTSANVESQLKEEIHVLLEENEKVKLCYDNLESELQRYKSDLEELNSNYQKSLNDNLRWEKEATSYKEELDDVCDENDKHVRHTKKLEGELSDTKEELERTSSNYQRVQAEKTRYENEYNTAAKERDEATSGYNELIKKLDEIQEERTLESRYTEALVKQRDNMNAIIENSTAEIEELKNVNVELTKVNKEFSSLGKEFDLGGGDAKTLREALAKGEKMKERLDTLGRERERYNATVKALKVDLRALHGGDVGVETSLQEHMRLLNEKWDANDTRLKKFDKLKSELDESIQLLEENAKDRDQTMKAHHDKVGSLRQDLEETQTALVKMEREKMSMNDKLSDYEILDAKMKRVHEELQAKVEQLQDRLAYAENECRDREAQAKSLDSDKRSMEAELDKLNADRKELEDVKKGLKKKLESAYYDLEETQRQLASIRRDHDQEMQVFENELSKFAKQKQTITAQEEEIGKLREMTQHLERKHQDDQKEMNDQLNVQMRLFEEKHADEARRNAEYMEQKHMDELSDLRERNKTLESAMKDQKESLDHKSMAEIKRRGEFAKQKQELEILRSKERHLETHVSQLEEHISKVVSDYEARIASSNQTICSSVNEETKALKKQVRELEKKLEVSSAAMKQIGKSSLLLEKENEKLKNDKNELKLKLRKLVDCAEKFGPK